MAEDAALAEEFVTSLNIVEVSENVNPTVALQRYLSVNSILSTKSSFAIRQQEATDKDFPLEIIGEGFCAMVYDLPSSGRAIKAGKPKKDAELWNDFVAHVKIWEAAKNNTSFCVPRPSYYVLAKDIADWMVAHRREVNNKTGFKSLPDDILVMERIMPLPRVIRQALVEVFCPPDQKAHAASNPLNKSCLVRLYLGVRRANQRTEGTFTLRNFELTLDKMDHLGIDPIQFVRPMAEALAIMHWSAQRDAYDVEFVLGSSPERRISAAELSSIDLAGKRITTWNRTPDGCPNLNFLRRAVSVWLLDFNQCKHMAPTPLGVEKAVSAFWENDPYFPRPTQDLSSTEGKLWQEFKRVYLAKSFDCLDSSATLPGDFIRQVEEKASTRLSNAQVLQGPPKSSAPTASSPSASSSANMGKKKERKYVSM
ncbi:uncharacterized protein GLRG_08907 [Colletotrichum graminicola M1.001]|uniref:DUF3669 domain-containing protein n=1 Tax=Colletotrichum graminicola (strain M1.001 / M2 / FGSC 10212) TaxID=645133 RepID=E3QSD6_COLGM|nr:uncharacterized protein GLRG_08907 [Colletotrichum graminicola M1.001]EFQ33763.1 hypothetical protein GLRG_08907 [Colletotrichum graminicola M1.001]